MAHGADVNFSVWEASASLELCIEVILHIELKQSYCENLESVPAVFAKLSWNFHLSLSGCSAFAGNRQYIAGLSIHSRDMTCFDGLYLKKSRPACSILGQNIDISFGPNGALHGARRWSTLRSTTRRAAMVHSDHDQLTFIKHLVQRKSQFPCGMLFLRLAQKQVQIWGRRFSSIVGFRSPNFAQRNTLVYWNRINQHFEVWEKKYWEMEFLPLLNESSPFCRTDWFQIHVKMAFFDQSVWPIGQGGWKLYSRPWFDS